MSLEKSASGSQSNQDLESYIEQVSAAAQSTGTIHLDSQLFTEVRIPTTLHDQIAAAKRHVDMGVLKAREGHRSLLKRLLFLACRPLVREQRTFNGAVIAALDDLDESVNELFVSLNRVIIQLASEQHKAGGSHERSDDVGDR